MIGNVNDRKIWTIPCVYCIESVYVRYFLFVQKGGGSLKRKRCPLGTVGCLVVLAGVLILMSLVLPSGFWWFVLAIILIGIGIGILRSC